MTTFQATVVPGSQVMLCQVHAIGKAISPFFADLVINIYIYTHNFNGKISHTE